MTFRKEYGPEPFDFGGKNYKVTFETLPGEAESIIGDQIRQENIGRAQAFALAGAMTKLVCDGTIIFKNQAKGGQRVRSADLGRLPAPKDHYDRQAKKSLGRHLTEMVVEHEFWLLDQFPEAFEEFVPEEEEAPRNPTAIPDVARIAKDA